MYIYIYIYTHSLLCPWDSPGKNTGVGCHACLQGIFLTHRSNPRLLHLPALAGGFLTTNPPGKPFQIYTVNLSDVALDLSRSTWASLALVHGLLSSCGTQAQWLQHVRSVVRHVGS